MNLYKIYTVKPYSFLVNDTTLASDNPLHFRQILEMIRDEKLKCDINKEAALLSGKTDEYEYLPGDKILPSGQDRMIEQDNIL